MTEAHPKSPNQLPEQSPFEMVKSLVTLFYKKEMHDVRVDCAVQLVQCVCVFFVIVFYYSFNQVTNARFTFYLTVNT